MTNSYDGKINIPANGGVIDPKLTKVSIALAAAMSKVTAELDKLNAVFVAKAANGGQIPDDMKPEHMPAIPAGGLPAIETVGKEIFITPNTNTAEDPLDALGDKASNAANALQELYDKLKMSPPDSALIAGAAYGITPEGGFTTEGDETANGEMGVDGEVPLTPEEKINEAQETEEAISAIKDESAHKNAALKAKEAEMAKKNMVGLVGMTKVGQKAMGAINSATALKNAVTNVAEGITTAVKSAPFPANVPAIAFATATGAAQIATIKGQFHAGIDSVPENGTYLLEQGERVVDKRLNKDLKGYLGAQGSRGGDTVRIDNAVNMSFSEGTTEDQVYEAKMKFEALLRDMYDEYAVRNPFD